MSRPVTVDVALIADLYQHEVAVSRIAEQAGCSVSTVLRHADRLGLLRRRRRYKVDIPTPPLRPSDARWKDLAPDDYIPRHPQVEQSAWETEPCGHEHTLYQSNCSSIHCRKGKAKYWAARREAVKSGAAEVAHHGVGGYRQGCPCNVCRYAVRIKRRDERAAKKRT